MKFSLAHWSGIFLLQISQVWSKNCLMLSIYRLVRKTSCCLNWQKRILRVYFGSGTWRCMLNFYGDTHLECGSIVLLHWNMSRKTLSCTSPQFFCYCFSCLQCLWIIDYKWPKFFNYHSCIFFRKLLSDSKTAYFRKKRLKQAHMILRNKRETP